jgi:tripartite-type tricarboxylate transporter receptor subunit TctC
MRMSLILATAAAAMLATATAEAAWPERPIRVIVPFGPGGTSDQIARLFQKAIDENRLLPQPINVVNVGGHFSVGARQVKDAAPDGYTFMVLHIALMGGEAAGAVDFGHRAFEPVASTSEFCLTPAVRQDAPYASLKDLLTAAREKPDTIVFGVNIGAINHMAAIMMEQAFPGARFRYVQVGGGAENFRQLAGGHTQAAVFSGAEYVSFKDGGARALGWTGPQRQPRLPDLATLKELGLDVEFCVANWWLAPKGTPKEAVDGMATALERAMATPYIKEQLDQRLFDPVFLQGDALARSLEATWVRIEPVAKLAAVKK